MNDIQQLQEKIAYQEQTIEALNEALTSQQQQLLTLQEELRLLASLVREWREDNNANTPNKVTHEIPPHY